MHNDNTADINTEPFCKCHTAWKKQA